MNAADPRQIQGWINQNLSQMYTQQLLEEELRRQAQLDRRQLVGIWDNGPDYLQFQTKANAEVALVGYGIGIEIYP